MGYTHYWSYKVEDPGWKPGFAQLQLDAKRIIEAVRDRGITLERLDWIWKKNVPANQVGSFSHMQISETPILVEGELHFNGGLPDEENHEDFCLHVDPMGFYRRKKSDYSRYQRQRYAQSGGWYGSFCKTARKPYDLAVCTILIRAAVLMPDIFHVSSDGHWDEEWVNGADCWRDDQAGFGAARLYQQLFGEFPPNVLQREMEDV